jgi:hypothetical protein
MDLAAMKNGAERMKTVASDAVGAEVSIPQSVPVDLIYSR